VKEKQEDLFTVLREEHSTKTFPYCSISSSTGT